MRRKRSWTYPSPFRETVLRCGAIAGALPPPLASWHDGLEAVVETSSQLRAKQLGSSNRGSKRKLFLRRSDAGCRVVFAVKF